MKKYTAQSDVSIKAVLPSGKSVRVSFASMTGGGSVFYTDDKELQTALESHYRFGTLFSLSTEQGQAQTETASQQGAPESAQKTEVHVSDMDEAKEYLAEKHGMNRTKMKRQETILKAAEALGITFVFD